ncbi:hypothetical protein MKX03_035565, partial [Papaver bracteatum]
MNQISRISGISLFRSVLRRNPFRKWSSKPIISNYSTSSDVIKTYPPQIPNYSTSSDLIKTYPPQIPRNHLWEFSGKPAAAEYIFGDDYLKKEFSEVSIAAADAQESIELGTVPPLDAVKIPEEKFKALMEKLGLDNEKAGDYPPHLQRFRKNIESLRDYVDETVAFGRYAATDKYSEAPVWGEFIDWYDAGGMLDVESESENESDNTNQ